MKFSREKLISAIDERIKELKVERDREISEWKKEVRGCKKKAMAYAKDGIKAFDPEKVIADFESGKSISSGYVINSFQTPHINLYYIGNSIKRFERSKRHLMLLDEGEKVALTGELKGLGDLL